MSKINKTIERLIVRSLDNALTQQEELELNRELIRNPEVRQLLEQYQHIDKLAVEALDQVIGQTGEGVGDRIVETRAPVVQTRRFHRGWFLVPGAVAAALLALVIPRIDLDRADPLVKSHPQTVPTPENQPVPIWNIGQNELMQPMNYPRTRRSTDRELLGVMGNDGKIYWIEVDHIQTIRQHRPASPTTAWNEM